MTKERLPVWQIPVTRTLDSMVEEAVSKDTHVSKSDLIRDAVREKLTRMGFSYVMTKVELGRKAELRDQLHVSTPLRAEEKEEVSHE